MAKVSIIVTVYNIEKYISQCLDSLINQTLQDVEIICIDDGSTDSSLNVLRDYEQKDERIKVITQDNKGVAGARNKGLEVASGKYVIFVDGDDWIEPVLCEQTVKVAEENQSEIVMYNVEFFDDVTGKTLPGAFFNVGSWKNHVDETTKHTYKDCPTIFYGNLSAANKLYLRDFLTKIGASFPENTRFEDHSFHISTVVSAECISLLDKRFYHYRQNRKNSMMSSLLSTKVVFDIFKIVDIIEANLKDLGKFDELKYLFFQFKYEAYAHYYMRTRFWAKPKYYKIMKNELFKMYEQDYDFTICKKMGNFFNFTDILNYNWFVCYLIKKFLDAPDKNRRRRFQPLKKLMENGFDEEAQKYA